MIIKIEWTWKENHQEVALMIGQIMCEIPHKEGMPISCSTDNLSKDGSKMLTTISNEGDK